MFKRKTYTPEIDVTHYEGFFMVSKDDAAKAIASRLTGSQFRLWHYLMTIDAFADFTFTGERIYKDIPSPTEIAIAIGASARTVEKDIKVLRDLELYDYRVTGWQGHNLSAEKAKAEAERLKNAKCSKPAQSKGGYLAADRVKQADSVLNSRQKVYLAENSIEHNNDRVREYSDCIQTDPDLNTQERVEKNSKIQEPEINQESSTDALVVPSNNQEVKSDELQIVCVGKSSEPPLLPTKKYDVHNNNGLNTRHYNPIKNCDKSRSSDPWMETENNPNRDFVQWLLNKRLSEQKNIKESERNYIPSRPNIKQEIRNNAVLASDWWDEFLEAMHHTAEVYQTRKAAGVPIAADEQNAIASIAPYTNLQLATAVLEPVAAPKVLEPVPVQVPKGAINPTAYKVFVAEPMPSEEESLKGRELFMQQTKQLKQQMSISRSKFIDTPTTTFAKHRAWLHSDEQPLREAAIAWAKAHPNDLEIEYDENGSIIDFEEIQF